MQMKVPPAYAGVLLLAIGVGVAAWGAVVLQNARASASWPHVQGQVTETRIERKTSTSGSGTSRRRTTKYKAHIEYGYSVGGTAYISDRVSFGEYSSSNQGHAQQIVNRYPMGKAVDVYYNPKKPQVSVLQSGVSGHSYTPLGVGVVFAIVGVAVMVGRKMGKVV